MRRATHVVTLFFLAVLVLVCRLAAPRPAQAAAPALPPAALKSLYQEKCSACHNLPDPQAEQRTRAQWQATVTRMLTRYHASDEISQPEAAHIVDYLATFTPAPEPRGGQASHDPWASDRYDVWDTMPQTSRIFNFEAGPLQAGLAAAGDAAWRGIKAAPGSGPDGDYVKVVPAKTDPSHFALLVDQADAGRDLDVRVRFQIISGHVSPSVGLAFGLADAANYSVLRLDARAKTLSVLQISPAFHVALQSTPLDSPLAPGWHTLRLLVNGGRVRGWIDGTKRISTTDPAYSGGKVALWTQGDTIAGFDDWIADFYTSDASAAPRT